MTCHKLLSADRFAKTRRTFFIACLRGLPRRRHPRSALLQNGTLSAGSTKEATQARNRDAFLQGRTFLLHNTLSPGVYLQFLVVFQPRAAVFSPRRSIYLGVPRRRRKLTEILPRHMLRDTLSEFRFVILIMQEIVGDYCDID